MQHFVNLCEYLHTFGSECNVSFARDNIYWSGRTRDGVAVVGHTSNHAVYLVARSCYTSFAPVKAEVRRSSRDVVLPRDEATVALESSERHLHKYIVPCRLFSGEDAEKSSTATDQGGDHRVRK